MTTSSVPCAWNRRGVVRGSSIAQRVCAIHNLGTLLSLNTQTHCIYGYIYIKIAPPLNIYAQIICESQSPHGLYVHTRAVSAPPWTLRSAALQLHPPRLYCNGSSRSGQLSSAERKLCSKGSAARRCRIHTCATHLVSSAGMAPCKAMSSRRPSRVAGKKTSAIPVRRAEHRLVSAGRGTRTAARMR